MAERTREEILDELKAKYGTVWSISRLNAFNGCGESYYRSYIEREQGKEGIYGVLGGHAHDTLEMFYKGEITYEEMPNVFIEKYIDATVVKGLSFPHGEKEATKWYNSVLNFLKTHNVLKYDKILLEKLVFLKIDDFVVQGYIDVILKTEDGKVIIYDWKTSRLFAKSDELGYGRQLVLYKLAIENTLGLSVDTVAWNMLKYCNVSYKKLQSNGKYRKYSRKMLRNDINKFKLEVMQDCKSQDGFHLDAMLFDEKLENWEVFPYYNEFEFSISDCIVEYDVTPELERETINYISKTIRVANACGKDKSNYIPKNDNAFMCHMLCGYGDKCKYAPEKDF